MHVVGVPVHYRPCTVLGGGGRGARRGFLALLGLFFNRSPSCWATLLAEGTASSEQPAGAWEESPEKAPLVQVLPPVWERTSKLMKNCFQTFLKIIRRNRSLHQKSVFAARCLTSTERRPRFEQDSKLKPRGKKPKRGS